MVKRPTEDEEHGGFRRRCGSRKGFRSRNLPSLRQMDHPKSSIESNTFQHLIRKHHAYKVTPGLLLRGSQGSTSTLEASRRLMAGWAQISLAHSLTELCQSQCNKLLTLRGFLTEIRYETAGTDKLSCYLRWCKPSPR